MDKTAPCTCLKFPGELLEIQLFDPFCNGDFTHRVMGSTDFEPEYGLDNGVKIA